MISSVGYEGRSVDGLVSELAASLAAAGIEYVHEPASATRATTAPRSSREMAPKDGVACGL